VLELQAEIYKSQQDTLRWKQTLYKIREQKTDDAIDFELIKISEAQNNKEELIKLAKEGYQKFNTDKWAFFYIISLLQNEQTDTLLNESFQILPSITTPHFKSKIYQIVGNTYSLLNNDSLAMQMYDSCLIYDPNNADVLNNVAYNITKQPNPDLKRAEKMAAKAIELEPDNTYIIDTYAWILFLLGDNFLSEFYFEKLLRIENNNQLSIETLYHLGCLYLKTNRIDKAKQQWQKALELYNQNPDDFKETDIINTIQNFFNDNK
jgi:tetratricopeptide (TPR) repeat protein